MNLNDNYTFDNFHVNENNKFAFIACKAIAEYPGNMYNPLYIYSEFNEEKEHLLCAIQNYIKANTTLNVLYVTADRFINDCNDATKKFRDKYSNTDILIIDDIQDLEKDENAQQQIFNIFNELYANNKQIILTSNCNPDKLKISERLIVRFTWGLSINIDSEDENNILEKN